MTPAWLGLLLWVTPSEAHERRRPGASEPEAAEHTTRRPAEDHGGVRRRPGTTPASPTAPPQQDGRMALPDSTQLPAPVASNRWEVIEQLGVRTRWWDPYGPHPLKADRPIVGDWFMSLDARSRTDVWLRTETPYQLVELVSLNLTWTKSQPRVRPPPVSFRIGGSFRASNIATAELDTTTWGLQDASIDVFVGRTSAQLDYVALRVGQQRLQSDPRGMLLGGAAPGARIYGTAWGNRLQFSLAWARMGGVAPFLGLTQPARITRPHDAFLATLYLRDLPTPGLEALVVALYDRSRDPEKPAHDRVTVGGGLDGHIGRLGLGSLGVVMIEPEPDRRRLGGMALLELGIDLDWARLRATGLWMSGDPTDNGQGAGFSPTLAAPQLAALESSVWFGGLSGRPRQIVPLDANDQTPGLWLGGLGASLELHPTLTLTTDASALGFPTASWLGVDLSMGLQWRPWLNEVLRVHLSGGAVAPGPQLSRWTASTSVPVSARGTMVWSW